MLPLLALCVQQPYRASCQGFVRGQQRAITVVWNQSKCLTVTIPKNLVEYLSNPNTDPVLVCMSAFAKRLSNAPQISETALRTSWHITMTRDAQRAKDIQRTCTAQWETQMTTDFGGHITTSQKARSNQSMICNEFQILCGSLGRVEE